MTVLPFASKRALRSGLTNFTRTAKIMLGYSSEMTHTRCPNSVLFSRPQWGAWSSARCTGRRKVCCAASTKSDLGTAKIQADATKIIGTIRQEHGYNTYPLTDTLLTLSLPIHPGNTALLRLNRLNHLCFGDIVCKLELMEPCCSVKDRIALAMVWFPRLGQT